MNLADNILKIVRSLAVPKGVSLAEAVAHLIRRSQGKRYARVKDGLPCFAVESDAPAITLEHTLAIEDDR